MSQNVHRSESRPGFGGGPDRLSHQDPVCIGITACIRPLARGRLGASFSRKGRTHQGELIQRSHAPASPRSGSLRPSPTRGRGPTAADGAPPPPIIRPRGQCPARRRRRSNSAGTTRRRRTTQGRPRTASASPPRTSASPAQPPSSRNVRRAADSGGRRSQAVHSALRTRRPDDAPGGRRPRPGGGGPPRRRRRSDPSRRPPGRSPAAPPPRRSRSGGSKPPTARNAERRTTTPQARKPTTGGPGRSASAGIGPRCHLQAGGVGRLLGPDQDAGRHQGQPGVGLEQLGGAGQGARTPPRVVVAEGHVRGPDGPAPAVRAAAPRFSPRGRRSTPGKRATASGVPSVEPLSATTTRGRSGRASSRGEDGLQGGAAVAGGDDDGDLRLGGRHAGRAPPPPGQSRPRGRGPRRGPAPRPPAPARRACGPGWRRSCAAPPGPPRPSPASRPRPPPARRHVVPGVPCRRSRARRIIAVPRPPPRPRPGSTPPGPGRAGRIVPRAGRRRVGRGRVDDTPAGEMSSPCMSRSPGRVAVGRDTSWNALAGGWGGGFAPPGLRRRCGGGGAAVTRGRPPVQERCHEPDARRRDGLPRCVRRARPFSSLASSPQRPGWGRRIAPRGALPRSAPRLGSPGAAATLDGSR